jgi:uncharacterized Zn-binding protein involved in type VI secretion
MTLPATRIYDLDVVHCSTPVRAQGSPNVFVNGRTWNRMGDFNFPHLLPCGEVCCVHAAPIAKGSSKVFVNGRGAGRVTDYVLGCTSVATGSPNVYSG